jgi:hypothetical protein
LQSATKPKPFLLSDYFVGLENHQPNYLPSSYKIATPTYGGREGN